MKFGYRQLVCASAIGAFILFVLLSIHSQGSTAPVRSTAGLELMSGSRDVQPHPSAHDNKNPPPRHDRIVRSELTSEQLRSQISQSIQERDYIIPPPERMSVGIPETPNDGELVSYTAFDGTIYSLHQFNGKYTAILIKPADLALFTIGRVRDLLDRVDILYAHFKEFLPLEPAGAGLARIAFVHT